MNSLFSTISYAKKAIDTVEDLSNKKVDLVSKVRHSSDDEIRREQMKCINKHSEHVLKNNGPLVAKVIIVSIVIVILIIILMVNFVTLNPTLKAVIIATISILGIYDIISMYRVRVNNLKSNEIYSSLYLTRDIDKLRKCEFS